MGALFGHKKEGGRDPLIHRVDEPRKREAGRSQTHKATYHVIPLTGSVQGSGGLEG